MSLNEKREGTNIVELFLFREEQLYVRECFCCLPEFGYRGLLTKVAADFWPFCKLMSSVSHDTGGPEMDLP